MDFWVVVWAQSVLLVLVSCSAADGSAEQLILGEGPWYKKFETGQLYDFSVDASASQGVYSAHVFQVHAVENVSLTLTNTSSDCSLHSECTAAGTHIGMVQLHYFSTSSSFSVIHTCVQGKENCSATHLVLVAVVGILVDHPIPGGCSLTSALEIEAGLSETKANGSFKVTFQDSDIGYDAQTIGPAPCTDQFKFVTRLEYKVYQKCVPSPTVSSTFKTIEGMLSAPNIYSDTWHFPFKTLSYTTVKKVTYYAAQQQGVVLNVVARDTKLGTTSAYIPTVSSYCDYSTGECDTSLPATTVTCAVLVGIIGLYLCVLAHRFFHVEVFLFTLLICVYIMYMILMSVTDLDGVEFAIGVAGCGLVLTILLFILWFFTNALLLFLTLFGVAMGFVITAAILYTPLGSYDLVRVPYIYILILLTGLFLWMLPFVFFASVMNIVSSAVVGSYSITFAIGLFIHSSFTDIVLRVAKNAAIPGYLSVNSFCELSTIDVLLILTWVVLCALSIIIQSILEIIRRRAFKRRWILARKYNRTDSDLEDPVERKYDAFPSASLFKQMRRYMNRGRTRSNDRFSSSGGRTRRGGGAETRPLLSPSKLPNQRYT